MSILDADTGGNIVNLKRPECSQLFFVYAAALSRVMDGEMNQMTFLRRSGLMGRNVTFIRDPDTVIEDGGIYTKYYENGLSAELNDMDSVIDWQKAYIESLPYVTEVYAVGNSFGGWSAMFFAYMLAMKKAFALAPAGDWGRDLLKELLKDPNGVSEYDVYYSRDIAEDCEYAESFIGYPSVNLITRDDHGHQMMRVLMETGELAQMMPEYKGSEAG